MHFLFKVLSLFLCYLYLKISLFSFFKEYIKVLSFKYGELFYESNCIADLKTTFLGAASHIQCTQEMSSVFGVSLSSQWERLVLSLNAITCAI